MTCIKQSQKMTSLQIMTQGKQLPVVISTSVGRSFQQIWQGYAKTKASLCDQREWHRKEHVLLTR
jgi:hypothetical protein